MEEYLQDVKKQLYINATQEYKENYITYFYLDEDIDNNLEYFKNCKNHNLSPYKALLFFYDYLNGYYVFD